MLIVVPRKQPSSLWPVSQNPATRVKIPDAMRIKGYSPSETSNQALQMQVPRKEAGPGPPAPAAASLVLALVSMATTARPALQTITPNLTVAPVVMVGGVNAGILPSPERKVKKTSHQEKIGKQNKRKRKAVHAQAHACATTLIAKERAMPKEDRQTTVQVIVQVQGEFRARGYGVTLSKNTINRYVALDMIGTFPLACGYKGMMTKHAFELPVLAVESYIQISNVNAVFSG
jgi:hypothetical protein